MFLVESIRFVDEDAQCVYEIHGEQWILWHNAHKCFMVTATRGGEEFYRNYFLDLNSLMSECVFDNRVRRLVACAPFNLGDYVVDNNDDRVIN